MAQSTCFVCLVRRSTYTVNLPGIVAHTNMDSDSVAVLREHLNKRSSFRLGWIWMLLVGALAPVVLGYLFISEIITKVTTPYEGYPLWFLAIFGWGMVIAIIVFAIMLSLLPWSSRSHAKDDPEYDEFLVVENYEPDAETGSIAVADARQKGARS